MDLLDVLNDVMAGVRSCNFAWSSFLGTTPIVFVSPKSGSAVRLAISSNVDPNLPDEAINVWLSTFQREINFRCWWCFTNNSNCSESRAFFTSTSTSCLRLQELPKPSSLKRHITKGTSGSDPHSQNWPRIHDNAPTSRWSPNNVWKMRCSSCSTLSNKIVASNGSLSAMALKEFLATGHRAICPQLAEARHWRQGMWTHNALLNRGTHSNNRSLFWESTKCRVERKLE